VSGSVVFFGTPQICIPFLDVLAKSHDLKLIVTQPDARGGRNRKTIVPAVKNYALIHKIPFIQPTKLNDLAVKEKITTLQRIKHTLFIASLLFNDKGCLDLVFYALPS